MKRHHILAGLVEINVQLRQVLQMSKEVATKIETGPPNVSSLHEGALEVDQQCILGNLARTEAAINGLIHEISKLRRSRQSDSTSVSC